MDQITNKAATAAPLLTDPFGRVISYLRVSVTDRCDFRCTYCMAPDMTFLPKKDLLSLEELKRLCDVFIDKGVRKLRLTGGEPLVRRNIMWLVEQLGKQLRAGRLDELTLTTNGSQLKRFARPLYAAGVRRINVSLDTLDADKFKEITRLGDLTKVLAGIKAAHQAGLKIKINVVALKDINEAEIPSLIEWAHGEGYDLSLIETMPLGDIEGDRTAHYLPLSKVRHELEARWTLRDIAHQTSGPARYVAISETGGRLGFITPLTHNFCEGCNRVRLTCTGQLYMCLGQEDKADLRATLRASESDDRLDERLDDRLDERLDERLDKRLAAAIDDAIARKPKGHDFIIDRDHNRPALPRYMNTTGG